jgi:hypothetical protein
MYLTHPSIRFLTFSLVCFCLSFVSIPLQAQDGNIPKVAVQNRKFNQGFEWTVFAGTLPLDAFKKGITAGGALTMHLNETWAWEAINYQYSFF